MTTPTRRRSSTALLARLLAAKLLQAAPGVLCPFAVVAGAALALPTTSVAQPAVQTGEVYGRVQNAATGQYLNNARVRASTGQETFTNEYGEYRFSDLPAGPITLTVFFTGLPPRDVPVEVIGGETLLQDVRLRAATDAAASDDEVLQLDAFVVATNRETNAAAIASNEQRFAPNIKTVISAEAFGDVAEGNVGEFVKYLPGVTVDYVAADVRTMSVRGFASAFTSIYMDGVRVASAASGSGIRAFEFEQVSINNITRIEVAKVPLPSMPANSLGGAVDMISKNAFERDKAQLKTRLSFNFNSESADPFSKTPGPGNKDTYKVLPGFDFDYTLPLTKDIGIIVTGLTSNQFNEQHRSQPVWNYAQAGATPTAPYLQQYVLQDGPKNTFRQSAGLRVDWRVAPGHVLKFGAQTNHYQSFFGNRNINWDAGTNNVPTPATGVPLTFSPEFTQGATGRGSVRFSGSFRDKLGSTNNLNLAYVMNGRDWDVDAVAAYSKSKNWYRDTAEGHFANVNTRLRGASRVTYLGITPLRPTTIEVRNAAGALLDPYLLANHDVDINTTANTAATNSPNNDYTVQSVPLDAYDEISTLAANARRDLGFLPFPVSVKFGGRIEEQTRDIRRYQERWNYTPPGGSRNAGLFIDQNYAGEDPFFGFTTIQWPSPYAAYDEFVRNPSHFTKNDHLLLTEERFRIQNSQRLQETITALYGQLEGKFFNNRLTVIGGARFEKTETDGTGGLMPSFPIVGTALPTTSQNLAWVRSNWRERATQVSRSYDDVYPSLHFTYNLTDDLVLKLAYALTIGRPDFGNILPLTRINDEAVAVNDGIGTINAQTIITNNTALQPWEGDNYDLSLEYYIPSGGSLSVGVFRKDIDGMFERINRTLTSADTALLQEIGLDNSYVGYTLQTLRNSDISARIAGLEFSYNQPLKFLPGWGEHFNVFANGTKLDLDGSGDADFENFIDTSANWGVSFSPRRFSVMLKWNYRGEQRLGSQTGGQYGSGTGFREYIVSRTTLDVNVDYRFTQRFSAFFNARNLTNEPTIRERRSATSAEYARLYQQEEYGIQITLGVKGTF